MPHLKIPVEEYTTPNPITAPEDAQIEQLMALMRDNGIRHLPITRERKVVGIISERDLKVAAVLKLKVGQSLVAKDIMTHNPITVSCEDHLDEVALEMVEDKIGSVIVNDENDELLGIFTVTDALNALIEISREE